MASMRWGIRWATLAAGVLVAVALVAATGASAAPKGVSGYFPASGGGQSFGGALSGPLGVAVNATGAGAAEPGDVYVAEGANNRVQVFSSTGAFKFLIGRDVVRNGAPENVVVNERQRVTVAGATAGSFRLNNVNLSGSQTPPIAFDPSSDPEDVAASARALEDALEAAPNGGAGNFFVAAVAPGVWDVEFVGALGDIGVRELLGDPAGLTPAGATVTVTTLQEGADVAERCTVASDCTGGPFSTGRGGAMFAAPQGIAIDQSDGSFYVSDRSNLRVQKFAADGSFERAWGKDVSIGNPSVGPEVCTSATDCVRGTSGGALARGGEFSSLFVGYLAVVPAGAPNAGNVVVADPANRRVQEFDATGEFIRAWGQDVVEPGAGTDFEVCTVAAECKAGVAGAGVGQFAANQPTRVAVDSTGAAYTVENTGNFRVQKFDAALTSPAVFAPGALSGTAASDTPTDVAVGAGDNVLVAKQFAQGTGAPPVETAAGERRVIELNAAGTQLDVHAALAGVTSDGLATGPGGKAYMSGRIANRIYELDTVVPATGAVGVSAVSTHSALFSGAVDPNGPATPIGVRTSYRLETSENGVDWSLAAATNVGNGVDPVGFSKTVPGLKANTSYQSRLVITKEFNPRIVVPGPSFTTPASRPDIEALSPADRNATGATLRGRIDPNGMETTYRFEYGPTAAYGTSVPVPDASVGAGFGLVEVSQPVSGLEPGTTYHFRLLATNANGTAVAGDMTFATPGVDPSPERGLELVSQPDKVGGVGVGLWPAGVAHLASAGVAAYTGDRFMVSGSYGAPLNDDSKQGFTNDWSFAQRTGAGWISRSPITHPNYQPRIAQFVGLLGVSQDLSRSFMDGANTTPALFPEMGTDNTWSSFNTGYFLDWGSFDSPSRWELLGPARLDQIANPDDGNIWNVAFAADGTRLVGQTKFDRSAPPRSSVFGLAGDGDPTWPAVGDLVAGRSVYLADTRNPADTYAGTGLRTLVNVCTDDGGRTGLPAVSGGLLTEAVCPAPLAGSDGRLISHRGAALAPQSTHAALGGTITEDGSRTFFMSPDPRAAGVPTAGCTGAGDAMVCPTQLFVREQRTDGSVRTRWISKAEPALFGTQAESLTGSARFEGATPDGDKVFFRTDAPLTVDDPNGTGAAPPAGGIKSGAPSAQSSDLYMYDLPDDPNADLGTGELTRISGGPAGSDCNSPLTAADGDASNAGAAALRFASDDGSRVYFTCSAPLDGVSGIAGGGITNPAGVVTSADQTNLYLYDTHRPSDRRWTFIARVPRAIGSTGDAFDICASTGAIRRSPLSADSGVVAANFSARSTAQNSNCFSGTADGGFVTFLTMGRLTADDPAGPATGDLYAYDAVAGEIVRITAPQGGAPGGTYLCAPGKPGSPTSTDTALCHGDGGADQQSAVSTVQGGVANAALAVVTHPDQPSDRVAFFQTAGRLVPEDLDSGYDVYQWRNGVLSLITSGAADSKDALYRGNDRSGRNVYFVTMDALTWQDRDAVADVYTARVGGGIPEPSPPPICDVLAGGCHTAPPAPQVEVSPNSSGPSADGDVVTERVRLSVARVGAKARRRAARSGVLTIRVGTSAPGTVRAVGRARVGGKSRRVGAASEEAAKAGRLRLRLRLSAPARKVLRAGRRLRVALTVTQQGGAARTATVLLERSKRS